MDLNEIRVRIDAVDDQLLKLFLERMELAEEVEAALDRFQDDGKEPNVMAEAMSWLKTNMKLTLDESDATIADLMTDGCNMGTKSLRRYLNQYEAADEEAKDIAKRLTAMEEQLTEEMRPFL